MPCFRTPLSGETFLQAEQQVKFMNITGGQGKRTGDTSHAITSHGAGDSGQGESSWGDSVLGGTRGVKKVLFLHKEEEEQDSPPPPTTVMPWMPDLKNEMGPRKIPALQPRQNLFPVLLRACERVLCVEPSRHKAASPVVMLTTIRDKEKTTSTKTLPAAVVTPLHCQKTSAGTKRSFEPPNHVITSRKCRFGGRTSAFHHTGA